MKEVKKKEQEEKRWLALRATTPSNVNTDLIRLNPGMVKKYYTVKLKLLRAWEIIIHIVKIQVLRTHKL